MVQGYCLLLGFVFLFVFGFTFRVIESRRRSFTVNTGRRLKEIFGAGNDGKQPPGRK